MATTGGIVMAAHPDLPADQLVDLEEAEAEVERAMARLAALRADLGISAREQFLRYEPLGMSCINAILKGCGRCVSDQLLPAVEVCRAQANEAARRMLSGPQPAEIRIVPVTEPAWVVWTLKILSTLSCGLCAAPMPQIEGVPAVQKSTTVSNQHDVLPSLTTCLQGEADLDLDLMAKGVRPMILALEALGAWTFIAVREMHSNLQKIEQSGAYSSLSDVSPRLMTDLLDAEVKADIHSSGGMIAQPSAAEGLLWLYRFLLLWREMWREPRPPTFKEAIDLAYQNSIRDYHSWLVQNTFNVAVSTVPSWAEARDALDELDVAGEAGLLRSIAALDPVLSRMEAAIKQRDLWDIRQV
mmetsp:Transcript_5641/g.14944  ORF Transcript_5641/g.14944 Transcript_5641/m.14944 type:complete len:356 (+) Transcript_5641:74-1141(+)